MTHVLNILMIFQDFNDGVLAEETLSSSDDSFGERLCHNNI